MWTEQAKEAYGGFQDDYDWGFEHFQNVEGYVATRLDGLWSRGPYLHNGSVPTLRDMLKAPDRRPRVFYRGYDVVDPRDGGFVASIARAEKLGLNRQALVQSSFRYDTGEPGNSNQGHVYGTDLEPEQKEALLAYLKTL
jgi:hypothetical protein